MATPLGAFLAQRRRALGLDRRTLAETSGLSYPYISQLESSDDKRPSEKALRLLAPALEMDLGELLERADGWTSGSLASSPRPAPRPAAASGRAVTARAAARAGADRTAPAPREAYAAALAGARRPDHTELVDDLARRLRRLPPAEQLAVLHELQARALEQLHER